MNKQQSFDEPATCLEGNQSERPQFFEHPSKNEDRALAIEPEVELFRQNFEARWWPGDQRAFPPFPKG